MWYCNLGSHLRLSSERFTPGIISRMPRSNIQIQASLAPMFQIHGELEDQLLSFTSDHISLESGKNMYSQDTRSLPWGAGVQATGFQQLWRTTAGYTQRLIRSLPGLFVQAGHHSLLDTCTQKHMVTASSMYLEGQPWTAMGQWCCTGAVACRGAQPYTQRCQLRICSPAAEREEAASHMSVKRLLSPSKCSARWSFTSMV